MYSKVARIKVLWVQDIQVDPTMTDTLASQYLLGNLLGSSKKSDLKVRDDGTLVQILCFWTSSIILSLFKNTILFMFQNINVSKTGFFLHL
jgi:hypothetical protein